MTQAPESGLEWRLSAVLPQSRALGRTKKRDPRWNRASDLSSPDRRLCAVLFVSVLKRSILGWFSLPPATEPLSQDPNALYFAAFERLTVEDWRRSQ
jgi:hypothetical protein